MVLDNNVRLRVTTARRVKALNAVALVLVILGVSIGIRRIIPADLRGISPHERSMIGSRVGGMAVKVLGDSGDAALDLSSGRVHVLFFYLNGCGVCKDQVSGWRRIRRRLLPDVEVHAISMSQSARAPYVDDAEIPEWVPVGPGALGENLRLTAVPATLVIDKEGIIRFARVGLLTPSQEQAVLRLAVAESGR